MHDTKGAGIPVPFCDRDEMHRAVISELASVIDHVRKASS